LINRDFTQSNRWTKAAVLYLIGRQGIEEFTMDLIAQLFNPDMLIRETAAWALHKINPDLYNSNVGRLGHDLKRSLDNAILDKAEKSTLMYYDKVLFFQHSALFEGMAGLTLSYLADLSTTVMLREGQVLIIDEALNNDFYIVYNGEVDHYDKNQSVTNYQQGQFVGERVSVSGFVNSNILKAKTDSTLLKFNKDRFYELMANHIKLANKVLEYI
jgi:ATP:ADP antiporter, AAA family